MTALPPLSESRSQPAGDGFVRVPDTLVVTLASKDSVAVEISLVVEPGIHIQSNPASSEFYIPLELTLEPVAGLRFGDPVYPPGTPYRLNGASEDLLTYADTVLVRVGMGVDKALPGEYSVVWEWTKRCRESTRSRGCSRIRPATRSGASSPPAFPWH